MLDSRELELLAFVSCLMWMLGTEPGSSLTAKLSLQHRSPYPQWSIVVDFASVSDKMDILASCYLFESCLLFNSSFFFWLFYAVLGLISV